MRYITLDVRTIGPNITGTIGNCGSTNGTGALSATALGGLWAAPSSSGGFHNLTLRVNANTSNAVYTDSEKVYPLSLALNFIIKA